MYQALKAARSEFIPIRQFNYHLRLWGEPRADQAPLFLVHGWMDVAASFQFVVDALTTDRFIVAPDWRGFGQTRPLQGTVDNYWFPDYMADLDMLIDHFNQRLGRAVDAPIDLVGHSMGGNVSMLYAGVRPQRVRRLVNLEGFGSPPTQPDQAAERYGKWMDELKTLREGKLDLAAYLDVDGVSRRLMKTNRRLSKDKADWLAHQWAAPNAQGRWVIQGDPAHKVVSAPLHRVEETLSIFQRITAPVLAVEASDKHLNEWHQGNYSLDEYHERLTHVRDVRVAVVQDAGHMLHHDRPQEVAQLIETHLA